MKKLLTATIIACLLCAACLGIFAACGGDPANSKKPDLVVWAPQEYQSELPARISAFKETYPDYADKNIQPRTMGVDDSMTQLRQDPDAAADVFLFPSGGITELVEAGLILPINVDRDEFRSMYTESAYQSVLYDGGSGERIYAVPTMLNTFIMYYNSSMYTEEEVKSLDTMMAKDLGDGVKNFALSIDDSWYLSAFFLSQQNSLSAPGKTSIKCNFNDANGYKVGEYLIDLAANSKFEATQNSTSGKLGTGELAAFCSGSWDANDIKEMLGDNYATAPLPGFTIEGTEYNMSAFGDYKSYGVNSATAKGDATGEKAKMATLLALFLGNPESQRSNFDNHRDVPTANDIINLKIVTDDKAVWAALQQEKVCTIQPRTTVLGNFWKPVETFGAELKRGEITSANLQNKLDLMVSTIERQQ